MKLAIRKERDAVVLVVDDQRAAELVGWRFASEVCAGFGRVVREEPLQQTFIVSRGALSLEFRRVPKLADELDDMVVVIGAGRVLLEAPVPIARAIWQGMTGKARELEEEAKAEQIAFDGALLLRTGAPIGITDNPRLQAEVVKEAGHNRQLRRYHPHGIKGHVLSAPRIFHDTRTPAERLKSLLASANAQQRDVILRQLH